MKKSAKRIDEHPNFLDHFVQIPTALLKDGGAKIINPTAFYMYAWLNAHYMRFDDPVVYPSIETLGDLSGRGNRAVWDALEMLRKSGHIMDGAIAF